MTLCDTGPLVALIDGDDPYHRTCVQAAVDLGESRLTTTWACLTEAMHFLYRAGGINAQNELWAMLSKGALQLYLPAADEWQQIQRLMNEYADMPLDMADASLVTAAEQLNDHRLFSMDHSLRTVRIRGREFFEVVP